MSSKVYEKRIVAFVDVLGFKNHIDKTVEDDNHAKLLLDVMKEIAEIKDDNDNGILAQKPLGKEVTVFSDCIVISYPLDFEGGLFHILIDLIHIQLSLIFKGIILRGGVAIGDVYHDDNIVFGPAMVEAYQLESRIAKYPRIIISQDTIIEGIKETLPSTHTPELEIEYIEKLIKVDYSDEKLYFLDILSQSSELDEPEYFYDMLEAVRKIITNELRVQKDKRVLEKYKWFEKYYNDTVKSIGLADYTITESE